MNEFNTKKWTHIIQSKHNILSIDFKEIWYYRDLIYLLVKRDFIISFKQTILGPLWFFINPILTTVMFIVIFGRVANLSTDGAPMLPFYLAGVTLWNYFSSCLTSISTVFRGNASVFGKVYFPRLVMPISIVLSNLLRFGVQFLLLILIVLYYYISDGSVQPNIWILITPVLLFLMASLAMAIGLIFSALTTKYKDFSMLLGFGVSLAMYITPVVMPASAFPDKYKWIINLNPLTGIFECFKYAYLGFGGFNFIMLLYTTLFTFIFLVIGILVFNKTEKTFLDTV
ncbi:ABC transporter permease [Faecalibacter macacae]|uniref:Transport permease protein n=1 Tax=Faecalibacter macacae TaxID=1859289 RepID=A0A3L9MN95_9FLAO|nr:ABC transporter permease [Faecalibacter macacae]RLZ12694.1 ABC transporter permease [Faecalibacter macacae]